MSMIHFVIIDYLGLVNANGISSNLTTIALVVISSMKNCCLIAS
jgi:hypothetical protein